MFYALLTRHQKQRQHLEVLVDGSEALCIVVLADVHQFLLTRYDVDGQVVIPAIAQGYQSTMSSFHDQIECHGTISHRHNRVYRIRITTANQVAQLLVDDTLLVRTCSP